MKEFANAPLVSFCITHKNRFSQIRETLPKNLADNCLDRDKVEFILVDFGSEEDVGQWLISEMPEALASGYLKYFSCSKLPKWHAPRAKNTAHRHSTGKILVNLDGDNFTGYRGGMFVHNAFMDSNQDVCLWQYSGGAQDGSFGRIAASRDAFFAVGGYNEEFLEMGFQDRDLVNRLEMIGAHVRFDPDERYNRAIDNEKYMPTNMNYSEMRKYNRFLSSRLRKTDSLIANAGIVGIEKVERLTILDNESKYIHVLGQ